MTSARHDRASAAAALLIGVAAIAIAFVKARAVSITHDEAVTYDLYVAGPWSGVLQNYTAGNHVLSTILERLSTLALGASELTLRLPALLASCVFVLALRRILRFVSDGWLVPLGMALILLNPMLLDYLSMARGYSLSLAAYAIGIEVALEGLARGFTTRTALGIGAALLVAVASNLTALIPCAGLAIAVSCALVMRRERGGGPSGARAIVACCVAMVVPIGLAIVPHLAAMQWEIGRHHFWYGTSTLARMFFSFDQRAIFHEAPAALVPVDEAIRVDLLSAIVSGVVSPALILGVLAASAAVAFGSGKAPAPVTPAARLLLLCGATIAATLALLLAANAAFGLLFPRGRTGLCLGLVIALGTIAMAVLLRASPRRSFRIAGAALAVLMLAFVLRFVSQIRFDRFGEGYAEAHNRGAFERLEALRPAAPRPPFRVFAHSAVYGPSMDFYRLARGTTWLAPIDRFVDPGVRYDAVIGDVHLAASALARRSFREVFRDPDAALVILVAN